MLKIQLPNAGRTTWDSRWPKEEGVFWFYGFPWGLKPGDDDTPDLLCVLVRQIANGFLYVTEGFTIDEGQAVGFWAPCTLPDKPCKTNIKEFRA